MEDSLPRLTPLPNFTQPLEVVEEDSQDVPEGLPVRFAHAANSR
jgi:hypothetical protein